MAQTVCYSIRNNCTSVPRKCHAGAQGSSVTQTDTVRHLHCHTINLPQKAK